jgi:hypothetical protein
VRSNSIYDKAGKREEDEGAQNNKKRFCEDEEEFTLF